MSYDRDSRMLSYVLPTHEHNSEQTNHRSWSDERSSAIKRSLHTWIETLLLERQPWWICWLSPWYRDRYLRRCVLPKLLAAQDAGTGIFEAWVEPGTSQTEVGRWLEACIATAQAIQDNYGMIRVVVAHCTEAEWEAGGADLSQHLVLHWDGMAHQWWAVGYPLALRATSAEHSGLYIALNITGMWISHGMGKQITHTA
jgi:hypothetical protein